MENNSTKVLIPAIAVTDWLPSDLSELIKSTIASRDKSDRYDPVALQFRFIIPHQPKSVLDIQPLWDCQVSMRTEYGFEDQTLLRFLERKTEKAEPLEEIHRNLPKSLFFRSTIRSEILSMRRVLKCNQQQHATYAAHIFQNTITLQLIDGGIGYVKNEQTPFLTTQNCSAYFRNILPTVKSNHDRAVQEKNLRQVAIYLNQINEYPCADGTPAWLFCA